MIGYRAHRCHVSEKHKSTAKDSLRARVHYGWGSPLPLPSWRPLSTGSHKPLPPQLHCWMRFLSVLHLKERSAPARGQNHQTGLAAGCITQVRRTESQPLWAHLYMIICSSLNASRKIQFSLHLWVFILEVSHVTHNFGKSFYYAFLFTHLECHSSRVSLDEEKYHHVFSSFIWVVVSLSPPRCLSPHCFGSQRNVIHSC